MKICSLKQKYSLTNLTTLSNFQVFLSIFENITRLHPYIFLLLSFNNDFKDKNKKFLKKLFALFYHCYCRCFFCAYGIQNTFSIVNLNFLKIRKTFRKESSVKALQQKLIFFEIVNALEHFVCAVRNEIDRNEMRLLRVSGKEEDPIEKC